MITRQELRTILIGDAHLTPKMAAALAYIADQQGRVSIGRRFATMATLKALEVRGLVELEPNMVELSPKAGELLSLVELHARRASPQGSEAERLARIKALARAPWADA